MLDFKQVNTMYQFWYVPSWLTALPAPRLSHLLFTLSHPGNTSCLWPVVHSSPSHLLTCSFPVRPNTISPAPTNPQPWSAGELMVTRSQKINSLWLLRDAIPKIQQSVTLSGRKHPCISFSLFPAYSPFPLLVLPRSEWTL